MVTKRKDPGKFNDKAETKRGEKGEKKAEYRGDKKDMKGSKKNMEK